MVTPIGADPDTFWDSLIAGRSGARPVRSFDTAGLPSHVGCEVGEYELGDDVRRRLPGGRCTQLAVAAAMQAVRRAGLEQALPGAGDAAVVVGTTMGEVTQFEHDRAAHAERDPDVEDVRSLARRPLDVMARSIAEVYRLRGPVRTVPTACAAGAYAIGMAHELVRRGRVRVALAVGCDAFSRLAFSGFSRMRAMSPDVCRPFSAERQGLLLGEGAAAVVVESERSARRRGAELLAFVDGFGLAADAHHITGPHPEGRGASRAMRDALRRAGVDATRIDYVNAHGTGTLLNERTESLARRAVFGERVRSVPVSSIKSLTGHMMGAAGAVEAVACVLAMQRGIVPPTWNWIGPDPDCDIDCVPNEARQRRMERVLSNSYAFGGNDASLVLTSPAAGA